MKKDDLLILSSILLFVQAYLFINILSALLGLCILVYTLSIYLSFDINLTFDNIDKEIEIIDNEYYILDINIENNSNIPIILKCIGTSHKNFIIECEEIIIPKKEKIIYRIKLIPKLKGRYFIDKLYFKVFDVYKIFYKDISLNVNIKINVYPSLESLKKSVNKSKNIELGRELLNLNIGENSLEIKELREYQPGDNPKFINWKISSKYLKLIYNEFLKEDEKICLVIDISNTFRRGKVDYLSKLIYYFILLLDKRGKYYKVILFDDYNVYVFDNINYYKAKKKIFKYLEGIDGYPNFQICEENNKILSKLLKYINGSVILVTDIGYRYGEIKYFIKKLKRKNSNLYIVSLNPFLFLDEIDINENNILKIYKRFKEREKIVNKLLNYCPIVDLGRNDIVELSLKVVKK